MFAANAFLYYKWKGLKEEHEDRERGKRLHYIKHHVSQFTPEGQAATSRSAKTTVRYSAVSAGRSSLDASEAKRIQAEMREIADSDLVQLQQQMISLNDKIAS